jgi:hypothetical protein
MADLEERVRAWEADARALAAFDAQLALSEVAAALADAVVGQPLHSGQALDDAIASVAERLAIRVDAADERALCTSRAAAVACPGKGSSLAAAMETALAKTAAAHAHAEVIGRFSHFLLSFVVDTL